MMPTIAGRTATAFSTICRESFVGVRAAAGIVAVVIGLAGSAHGFACGSEQQIAVTLDHAVGCQGAQGWIAIDESALTVFEIVDRIPGCALTTHWHPSAGTRHAILRWSVLCSEGQMAEQAPLLMVRAFVKEPTTITGRVDVAADRCLMACGATLRAIPIRCE